MKKILLVVAAVIGLSACVQQSTASQEDAKLKQAYSNCINTAEGNPDKISACQSVLEVLKQSKTHQAFAEKESVRVFDYQNCIQAAKTGAGDNYQQACSKVWQEIRSNNN